MGQSLFKTLFVFGRTLAYVGLEGGAEVALAGETCHIGNLGNAEVRVFDQTPGFFQTYSGDVFLDSSSCDCLHLVV